MLARMHALGIDKISSKVEEPEVSASFFQPLRFYFSTQINQYLPQPQAALLAGMLIGEKSDLPADFRKDLTNTSTIHIVVVSGQNLTLVAGFIMGLTPFLGRRKTIILSLFVIVFYSLMTGLQVPVIRSAIMFGIASIASLFGREKEGWWVLSITILLMLIFNPSWILSISFQLSVLATIGVVLVAPELDKLFKYIPDILRQDLSVSLAAQALTMPIIAANFHNVSIIGLLVNSLILFTVAPIMILGAIALLLSLLIPALGQFIFVLPNILLTFFVYIIEIFAKVPLASVYIRKLPIFLWLGYFVLCLAAFLAVKKYNLKYAKESKDSGSESNISAYKFGL